LQELREQMLLLERSAILPCLQQRDRQLREVVQQLLHLVLPILVPALQLLALELVVPLSKILV
jgi:hypothetical protein